MSGITLGSYGLGYSNGGLERIGGLHVVMNDRLVINDGLLRDRWLETAGSNALRVVCGGNQSEGALMALLHVMVGRPHANIQDVGGGLSSVHGASILLSVRRKRDRIVPHSVVLQPVVLVLHRIAGLLLVALEQASMLGVGDELSGYFHGGKLLLRLHIRRLRRSFALHRVILHRVAVHHVGFRCAFLGIGAMSA